MKQNKYIAALSAGILKNNPVFMMLLGLCPTLAVTGSLAGALGMGISTLCVLTLSGGVISLFKKQIPSQIRLPAYIVIIATFVTVVGLLLEAYFPMLHERLGIYLSLITVNCIILGRAESFASKASVPESMLDGFGSGIGFTLALSIIAFLREALGAGRLLEKEIPFIEPFRLKILQQPAGGFLIFALCIAAFGALQKGKKKKSCEGCGGCRG